jgi:hypothetical protein
MLCEVIRVVVMIRGLSVAMLCWILKVYYVSFYNAKVQRNLEICKGFMK